LVIYEPRMLLVNQIKQVFRLLLSKLTTNPQDLLLPLQTSLNYA